MSTNCHLLHKWTRWKVLRRGSGIRVGDRSDIEIVILERVCARCNEIQLKQVISR